MPIDVRCKCSLKQLAAMLRSVGRALPSTEAHVRSVVGFKSAKPVSGHEHIYSESAEATFARSGSRVASDCGFRLISQMPNPCSIKYHST